MFEVWKALLTSFEVDLWSTIYESIIFGYRSLVEQLQHSILCKTVSKRKVLHVEYSLTPEY